MAYILIPGRHLALTSFQDTYLRAVLGRKAHTLRYAQQAVPQFEEPLTEVIYAITSANQQHSRYNPIPFHVRAVGVDRFAAEHRQVFGSRARIFGIPHYGPTDRFAQIVLKEIESQDEGDVHLSPLNTVVLCSTPALIAQYAALGFCVLQAEADADFCQQLGLQLAPPTPIQLIERLVDVGEDWQADVALRTGLAPTTYALWCDFPDVPRRVIRLWRDPLLNDSGSLTDTRNYSTYAFQMSNPAILELKYQDIKQAIVEGRIVDEGCADAALFIPIARDFPDSDLIGIDITAEFLARAKERQRAGEFGKTYVHFHQRNILEPVFEPNAIQTTICNSTAHELWSYGQQRETLVAYLAEKYRQTAPGGRIIIRDVVGVEDNQQKVLLHLTDADGSNEDVETAAPETLSTRARFFRFAKDFLRPRQSADAINPVPPIAFQERELAGKHYVELRLKDAHEYLLHKDYTDNWESEMHEEFGFWAYSDWQRELEQVGFQVVVNPSNPVAGSRTYANPWVIENRWVGKVALYIENASGLEPLPWPVTNLVLVGEKPPVRSAAAPA